MPVTPAEIDAAVPPAGTPNRGLTNTALKGLIDDIAAVGVGIGVGTVNTFADLPAPATVTGQRWWVLTSTGVWLVNRRNKGAYYSDGAAWSYLGDFPVTAAEVGNVPAGGIAAGDVQAAINELDSDKTNISVLVGGNGSSGNLTASSGTTTLTDDTFYDVVTLSGTAQIVTAGFRLYIRTLDLTDATGAGPYISRNGVAGATSTTQTGAATGATLAGATVGGNQAGQAGATGIAGVGPQATAVAALANGNGGAGGASGKGGNGTPNAGGASRASVAPTSTWNASFATDHLIRGIVLQLGGGAGQAGNAGGGDGTNLGRGGGGSATGGGVVFLSIGTLITGAGTSPGAIQARGGAGGASTGTASGNAAGGGGGGGGGGGWIYALIGNKTGPVVTGLFDVSGGAGGAGGTGAGTGLGGQGGAGGGSGRIKVINFTTGVTSSVLPAAAAALPAVPATATGNAGTAGTIGVLNY